MIINLIYTALFKTEEVLYMVEPGLKHFRTEANKQFEIKWNKTPNIKDKTRDLLQAFLKKKKKRCFEK